MIDTKHDAPVEIANKLLEQFGRQAVKEATRRSLNASKAETERAYSEAAAILQQES